MVPANSNARFYHVPGVVRVGVKWSTSLGWNGSCFLQQFCSGPFHPSTLLCHVVQKPSFHWFKQVKRTNQDWPLLCAWTISPQCSSMSRDTESYISLVQAIVKRTNQDWGTLLWVCVGERGEPFHPRGWTISPQGGPFHPRGWTISPQRGEPFDPSEVDHFTPVWQNWQLRQEICHFPKKNYTTF